MKRITDEEWKILAKKYKDDPKKLRDYLRSLGYTEQEIDEIINHIKRYIFRPIPSPIPFHSSEEKGEDQPDF